jgi:hypothetical protein
MLFELSLPEISKMEYRNQIPEPGTTISGFANSLKKNKKINCVKIDRVVSKN